MEFANLHEHVAWLTGEFSALEEKFAGKSVGELEALEARVAALETRLSTATNLAKAAMAEIKEHEAETANGQTDHEEPEQVGAEVVRGAEPLVPNS